MRNFFSLPRLALLLALLLLGLSTALAFPAQAQTQDASVVAVRTLTRLPIPAGAPHVVHAVIRNTGTVALTNLPVTLTVRGANAFSDTQTLATLARGTSATVSFAGFTPTATGIDTVIVTVPADARPNNNRQSVTQEVNTTTYSYAVPGGAAGVVSLRIPVVDGTAITCRYRINSPVNVTQVRSYIVNAGAVPSGPASTIGKTVYGVVVDAGTHALLARSADHVVTAADIDTYVSLPLTTLVAVPAGTDLLVGMVQLYPAGATAGYFPFGTHPIGPPWPGAFYVLNVNTLAAPFDLDLSLTALHQIRPMIEAVTAPATPCAGPTNLTATALTTTSATLTFTAPAGAGPYTLTYTANGGAPTTRTPAPIGSPVVLSGLSPATAYAVTLTSTCGAQTSLAAAVAFTTPQSVAPYASLPVSESFEGSWLDVAAVHDAPAASWRNTPATGLLSWRRNDDGASANWLTNNGAYTPVSSQGAHSARFNSYDAPANTTGALDLYVDMSAAGPKTLTFDYVNVNGTDSLAVLVSDDGGLTFASVPVLTAGVSATFTPRTVTLTGTSPTTVIRFRATSDFGLTNIGLDNLRLSVLTGTPNEVLAAQVGLSPNPAHHAFTLHVPAGLLGAGTATLRNALGQVVLTRPLGLPATGGTTSFDVRGLAAGVYTLHLLSGETRVTKRVVLE